MAEGVFAGAFAGELVSRVARLVETLATWKDERNKVQSMVDTLQRLSTQQLSIQQRMPDWNGERSKEQQELMELVADAEDWVHYATAFASSKRKSWQWPQKLYARHVSATKLREVHQDLKDCLQKFEVTVNLDTLRLVAEQGQPKKTPSDDIKQAYQQHLQTAKELKRTLSSGGSSDSVQDRLSKTLKNPEGVTNGNLAERKDAATSCTSHTETSGGSETVPGTDDHLYSLEKHIENVVKALTGDGEQHLMGIVGAARKWNLGKEASRDVAPEAGRVGVEGMGGIGKTTLATKVYEHKDVQSHFGRDGTFRLTISQTLDEVRALQSLWEQVFGSMAGFPSKQDSELVNLTVAGEGRDICDRAREKLGRKMKEKGRVLLFLDDVWKKEHVELFECLVRNAEECKVLVTTRDAELLDSLHWQRYSLNLLDEETSLKLFCRHAFGAESAPEGLTDVVREACKECKGLPLALRVIGASFRDISSLDAWQSRLAKMHDSVPPDEDTKKELYGRLRLSVDHLPFPILKELFVDFAAYPEDHLIPIRRLVDTWAVDPRIGTAERALIFLSILISRSLVEFSPTVPKEQLFTHSYAWNLGVCRVHDLLRDVAVQLASEEVDQRRRKQLFFVGKASFDPCAGEYKAVKIAFHNYQGTGGIKYLDLVQLQKSLKAPHLQVLEMRHMFFAKSETWQDKWLDSNRLSKRVAGIAAMPFVRLAELFVGERQTAAKWHRGFTHCPSLRVLECTRARGWGPCDVGNESLRVLRWGIYPHTVGLLDRAVYLGHHRRLEVLELNADEPTYLKLKVPTASLRSMLRLRALSISRGHFEWLSSLAHMSWLEELHLRLCNIPSANLRCTSPSSP